MKQKTIDFRELLERVLPIDDLPAAHRMQVQRALREGVPAEIERAGLQALAQLERRGSVRRLVDEEDGLQRSVRYQPNGAIDVIRLEVDGATEADGVRIFPRSSLPTSVRTGIDQVRRLLRLDDPILGADPRSPNARASLVERLNQSGHEVLPGSALRFVPLSNGDPPAEGLLSTVMTLEVSRNPDALYYSPDTFASRMLEVPARHARIRALAMVAVRGTADHPLGVLEVTSPSRDAFSPDDLAMIALLADHCAAVLERAERIEKLVFIDPLTSAYNRSYFDLQVLNEMARAQREHSSLALCIADIDDFKSFNSSYGYEAGNQVLVQVAQSLRRGVRPFDTVARWGGEEFAVLLTAPIQAQDVVTISERLRSMVERQEVRLEALDRQSHRVSVTVSIGVALFPDHETNAADLWRAANQALLMAKRAPKNQVVFFRPPAPSAAHAF
jgi:diguanylate cyclase (GGDEF)-like protein